MAPTPMKRVSRLPGLRHLRPFWQSLSLRLQNILILPATLPGLIRHPQQRALFREAQTFVQTLPERLQEPLPTAVKKLNTPPPTKQPSPQTEKITRNLADLAVLLHRRSPLGICMRRSLTRYYFLRREGLPLQIHFGARFSDGKPDREITGHAWLTLNNTPYHEPSQNWRGFTIMLTFPHPNKSDIATPNDAN